MRVPISILILVVGTYGATIKSQEVGFANLKADTADSDNYTVESLVESNGYSIETHTVTTTDGYILTVHRIPSGLKGNKLGKVAFLQHGILSSSADWCILGAANALAFVLADAGYDVWLGNHRGNTWSQKHVNLSNSSAEFWQYSFHEIGTIDVPQMIDYVLEQTGASGVYYVGHSEGTSALYVMLSTLPEYNEKILVAACLAPIAYMNHMTSPLLKIVSYWTGPLGELTKLIGLNEFLPNDDFMKYVVGEALCGEDSVTQLLCTNSLFAICGFSRAEMNTTLLPIMTKYTPAGASTKQLLHYGQEIVSGYFRQYDYGIIANMEKYGSISPPSYDLSKITSQMYLFWSENDWLSARKDVEKLSNELGSALAGKILISDLSFNHLDYLFGIDAKIWVYDKVVSVFARN